MSGSKVAPRVLTGGEPFFCGIDSLEAVLTSGLFFNRERGDVSTNKINKIT
jgi:hypothetical protein